MTAGPTSPDPDGRDEPRSDQAEAAYRDRLAAAYVERYAKGTDIWSDEAAMTEVGRQFGRWIGPPVKRVLDVGAGRGRDALHFAGLGHDVTAIDLVVPPPAVRPAVPGRLVFLRTDIRAFRPDAGFDAICDNGCYHHEAPPDQPDYLARLADLMRGPQACLCLSVFAAADGRGDLATMPDGRMRRTYAVEELAAELGRAGFAVADHRVVPRERPGRAYLAVLAHRTGGGA